MAGVDAGSVQSYRHGGNFAYAFNTPHHHPVPFMHSDRAFQSINFVDPNLMKGYPSYSNPQYPYYMYPELSVDDELFRTGEEINGRWFISNPHNTAHAIASTSSFPVITASASGVSTSNGITVGGSASNAIFQFPLLRLFHRVFNRSFSFASRPNRLQSYVTSGSSSFGDADTVVINALY